MTERIVCTYCGMGGHRASNCQRRRAVDWWRVITDLERAGCSHSRIASEVLRGKAWVDGLKNVPGYQPKHGDGEVVIELWCRYTGHPRDNLPRETL